MGLLGLDFGTTTVAAITLILFVAALYSKGLTHDLLLEAGVFLVSVKLMIMAYKNHASEKRVEAKLDEVLAALRAGRTPS